MFKSQTGSRFLWRQPLGRPECPYAYRWVLPLGPLGSLRLHHWVASDDLRASHNHPSDFITIILKGGYHDYQEDDDGLKLIEPLKTGDIRFRKASHRHKV